MMQVQIAGAGEGRVIGGRCTSTVSTNPITLESVDFDMTHDASHEEQ